MDVLWTGKVMATFKVSGYLTWEKLRLGRLRIVLILEDLGFVPLRLND